MVPKGWKEGVIEDIAKVSSGGTPSRNEENYWSNGNIPWIRTTEVQNCVLNYEDTQEFITREGLEGSSAKLVPSGTLLMAMIGQGKTRGQIALLNFEATTNQNCATILLTKNNSPEFYFNYLLSKYERIRNWSNSAGQSNLSGALVKAIPILIPPLPEQQKIAKILSTWDKAISTTERLIENSTQQKKALMQQLLTGKKRLLDESGKRFEGDWEEVKLKNIGATFNGLTGKTKVDFGSGEPYITYMNIFKNTFINEDGLDFVDIKKGENQNTVKYGDIFFTTSSETPHEVGMSSVFLLKNVENIYLNSFCFGFRSFSLESISPIFIGYMLRSSSVRRKIAILAQGATRYNLSKVQLLKISIKMPSLKEQQKIATVLTNADKEIDLLEQQLADLQQEKKALMQQLLTGKKRVAVDGEVMA